MNTFIKNTWTVVSPASSTYRLAHMTVAWFLAGWSTASYAQGTLQSDAPAVIDDRGWRSFAGPLLDKVDIYVNHALDVLRDTPGFLLFRVGEFLDEAGRFLIRIVIRLGEITESLLIYLGIPDIFATFIGVIATCVLGLAICFAIFRGVLYLTPFTIALVIRLVIRLVIYMLILFIRVFRPHLFRDARRWADSIDHRAKLESRGRLKAQSEPKGSVEAGPRKPGVS